MPDSGAVYQPTTVGYSYDGGRDVTGSGIRSSFSRIMSRHKLSTKKWFELVLLSVAVCAFVAGLTTMIVNLVYVDTEQDDLHKADKNAKSSKDSETEVEESCCPNTHARGSIAVGAAIMLFGLLLGFVWVWLKFFRKTKSPRSGMASSGGQMLGGLNPSTDLLVGSTSQYGPVLTELPSQTKLKQANSHETPAIPLSDQEEETRTLMQDSSSPQATLGGPNTITDRIPG